jgi:hypothetical protein
MRQAVVLLTWPKGAAQGETPTEKGELKAICHAEPLSPGRDLLGISILLRISLLRISIPSEISM